MSDQEESPSQQDQDEEMDEDGEDMGEEEDDFINNHDLIGVEGIILAQKNEIEQKKVSLKTVTNPNSSSLESPTKSIWERTQNCQG